MVRTSTKIASHVVGVASFVTGRDGHVPEYSRMMARLAVDATADAGLELGQIDGLVLCSSVPKSHPFNPTAAAEYLGLGSAWTTMLPYGGKPAAAAADVARAAIVTAGCTRVLVLGLDTFGAELGLRAALDQYEGSFDPRYELPHRPSIPSMFALMATQYLDERGASVEDLARVASIIRQHGRLNPLAELRVDATVESVLESPMVSTPLTRDMLAMVSRAGGVAFVISPEPEGPGPVSILGYGESAGFMHLASAEDLIEHRHLQQAGDRAYAEADVTADDIDVAQFYDPAAIVPLLLLENLGFCAPGEGPDFVRDGHVALGGRMPITTNGGIMSYRHPGWCASLDGLVEAVVQLRHAAGERQVDDAEVALVHSQGSWLATNSVMVLGRS